MSVSFDYTSDVTHLLQLIRSVERVSQKHTSEIKHLQNNGKVHCVVSADESKSDDPKINDKNKHEL